MLRNVKDLRGYVIRATDGVIGAVDDLYFDDETWAIRYLIVDTGNWLSGRKVLISPVAIGQPDWLGQQLPVSLTKAQVERSPDIDTRKPVSRQHEAEYFEYYDYPYYWEGSGLWGMGAYPGSLTAERATEDGLKQRRKSPKHRADDCHLRSSEFVMGHHVHAKDGDIGHVQDLLVDDHTWAIRYLIVDTSNWWGGHLVLVAPKWIEAVSWPEAKVNVDLTRRAVRVAPPYDAAAQLSRQQEQAMHEHYGRPGYWTVEP
jgi:sporulation protein YlmC with PRC-barrel domain